jgi:CubicO group peptidase (beta-lactamase class C family)
MMLSQIDGGGRDPNRRTSLATLVLSLLLSFSACKDSDPTVFEEYNSLALEMGFDVGMLNYGLDIARASGTVQGVVVDRYGTVAAETYAPGAPPWGLFETWTVTATVTSLLVGEALETGYLQSLDQTLGELLSPWGQYLDDKKAGITVRQLLTMTSGISRPYGTVDEYFEWLAHDDQVAWVLDRPLRSNPGEKYYLDSAAAHLLSAVLTQVTGKSLADLAQEAIMDPLGVPWTDWMVDANGFNYGGFGLRIRTRDMAKIARLVLNQGVWDGTEVVSPSWIQESTRPHLHPYPDYPEWGFGYLWKSSTCSGYPCTYASGYGGQILVAVPDLDLVVAVNSTYTDDEEGSDLAADNAWGIVLNYIVPSARN